jgi:hypothetical protein
VVPATSCLFALSTFHPAGNIAEQRGKSKELVTLSSALQRPTNEIRSAGPQLNVARTSADKSTKIDSWRAARLLGTMPTIAEKKTHYSDVMTLSASNFSGSSTNEE